MGNVVLSDSTVKASTLLELFRGQTRRARLQLSEVHVIDDLPADFEQVGIGNLSLNLDARSGATVLKMINKQADPNMPIQGQIKFLNARFDKALMKEFKRLGHPDSIMSVELFLYQRTDKSSPVEAWIPDEMDRELAVNSVAMWNDSYPRACEALIGATVNDFQINQTVMRDDLFLGPLRNLIWGIHGLKSVDVARSELSTTETSTWTRDDLYHEFFDFSAPQGTLTHLYLPIPNYLRRVDAKLFGDLQVLSFDPEWLGIDVATTAVFDDEAGESLQVLSEIELPELRELYLPEGLEVTSMKFLSRFDKLEELQVDVNALSPAALGDLNRQLPGMTSLKTLIVLGNVNHLSSKALSSMKSLQTVRVDTAINSDRDLRVLSLALPTGAQSKELAGPQIPQSFLDHREQVIDRIWAEIKRTRETNR
jgi:hypothetical protein